MGNVESGAIKILLDTCCVIWAVSDVSSLRATARQLLAEPDTGVSVSCVSCAEIACLADRGRIVLDRHWKTWFNHYVERNGWEVLDLNLEIIQEAWSLPGEFHTDPADRLLTATARVRRLALLTADRKLLDYPHVDTVW